MVRCGGFWLVLFTFFEKGEVLVLGTGSTAWSDVSEFETVSIWQHCCTYDDSVEEWNVGAWGRLVRRTES